MVSANIPKDSEGYTHWKIRINNSRLGLLYDDFSRTCHNKLDIYLCHCIANSEKVPNLWAGHFLKFYNLSDIPLKTFLDYIIVSGLFGMD